MVFFGLPRYSFADLFIKHYTADSSVGLQPTTNKLVTLIITPSNGQITRQVDSISQNFLAPPAVFLTVQLDASARRSLMVMILHTRTLFGFRIPALHFFPKVLASH
jgi:hypothetical protein